MADYSFGLGRTKTVGAYVDQTLIGTPIPVTTSTVDKKIPENVIDGARLMRLEALRSRASWISNLEYPQAEPKENPLPDKIKNDVSEASRSSSSKATTGHKSTESFQSILNLQTMEDLSGSVIDVNFGSERMSNNPTSLRINVEKEPEFRKHLEGNKENSLMPCVGISPGDSLQNEEDGIDEVLRTRHESGGIESFKEDLTLNWDEITRPPSPPVNDRSRSKQSLCATSNSPRWVTEALMPSRLLGRTEAVPALPVSSVEVSSGSQRRLESILASDNSELSSFSLSGGSGVRMWVRNIPSGCGSGTSDACRSGLSKTSPPSPHNFSGESANFGKMRSKTSLLMELEKTPDNSFPYSDTFDGQRVTSSSNWLAQQQIHDDTWRGLVAGRENANILSGIGLSSESTPTYSSHFSPASAAAPERMTSIREEEEAIAEVTLTDNNESLALPDSKNQVEGQAVNHEAQSISALHVDSASVAAASGQSRGVRGHPLASSTVASLTASMASSDDGSSLVNLSDIRNAFDNDLWESHGPAGMASFVESRAKEMRRKKKEKQTKPPSPASKDSKDSSTIRAGRSGTTQQSSGSPAAQWVSLRESLRGSPAARRTQEDFVDLAASTLERSAANGFITSLASSQLTAVKVNNINTNNNNLNGNSREASEGDDGVMSCVAQLIFPTEVTFVGVCLRGCQTERTFTVTNRCQRTVSCQLKVGYCAVNGELLAKEVARTVFPVRPSLVVGADATRSVRVFFKPHRAGVFSAELHIVPEHSPAENLVVNLSAGAEAPQLRLLLNDECPGEEEEESRRRLDFGPVVWGTNRVQRVVLMNEGQAELPVVVRLSVTSRLALRCFGLRAGEGGTAGRQVELTLGRGGSADLELSCHMPEHQEEEQAVQAQACLTVSLQGISQDPAAEPLTSLPLRATAGTVRLVVPRHFAVVRLSERRRSASVPLRNEGSLLAAVRISLETSPGSADASALRLVSPPKASILPGEQTLVQLNYDRRRRSFGSGDRFSGTLFAFVEPSGPVFEVPVVFDSADEADTLAGSGLSLSSSCVPQQPPLVASKTHLMWAGVNVGSSEQQRLLLKNTTGRMLHVTLCVEALEEKKASEAATPASDDQVFFLSHPKTAAACHRLRLDLHPECDFTVRLSFRPNAPRFSRARLLIRLSSHKITFIVGLRGYGGRGHLVCAGGESGPDGVQVVSGGSRSLLLYNRGDRCVWAEAEMRPDCSVEPRSFLVPAGSSKKILLKFSKGLNAAWDASLRFRYGDEILRLATDLCAEGSWPTSVEDPSGAAGVESLPFEDRGLAWQHVVTGVSSELAVRLKERRYDGSDGASAFDESCCSSNAGAGESMPLRETMVRVGHWSVGESKLEARSPLAALKSGARSSGDTPSRDPRSKLHVEEWLRQQQELTASQLTSTTTFGKSLLRLLTPLEVNFTAVGGPQERSLEWLNASPWPLGWRLRSAGPLRCENAHCSGRECPGSGSASPFSFSPLAVARLAPGALQRVRLTCSGANAASCPGPHRQQWHLTAAALEEEEEEEESSVRRQENHPVLLTLRVASVASQAGVETGKSRLLVRQREVRFPLCRVHSRMEERLKVTNRSSQPVAVLFRALPEPFRLGDRAPSQLVLKAAHCIMLPLVFRPAERGRFEAMLGIECPDLPGEAPIRVLLTGEAED